VRVALAHEWLVRYAGSERVLEALLEIFPGSTVFTTILEPERMPDSLRSAETSFIQHLPGSHSYHEWFIPLMPLAWRTTRLPTDIDLVLSSSHCCAKAVRPPVGVPHICYCHTPIRYAWDFETEKQRFPAALRPAARAVVAYLRRWDRAVSPRVTQFVANSNAVKERIKRFYGRNAVVVHPPVRTEFFTPEGEHGDRFLLVSRLTGYKRPDLVIDAFADLPFEIDIVGQGPMLESLRKSATANIRFHPYVSDDELRDLYRRARALVYPAEEDFGIVMAEAQACGTPVIGLACGGARDIVEPGITGSLIERQEVGELRAAVRRAALESFDPIAISARADRFSFARFRTAMTAVADRVVAEGATILDESD
jgi:glycosyltransferase involved in cell wall biosynthesis